MSTDNQPELKRILFASYGGGHVHSLVPVIQKLKEQERFEIEVIGFTTAQATFMAAGITAQSYRCLLQKEDEYWLELARQHKPEDNHPTIAAEDSLAYHALGLRDLVREQGEEEALRRYQQEGRKAFLPVDTFSRYLLQTEPDLVVTSTSPRSELALQYAANDLNIPGVAISDLFLQSESRYLCTSRYAPHITVIAQYVAEFLQQRGCEAKRLYVLGNPAFDNLADSRYGEQAKALRSELGFEPTERIILWVCASAAVSMIGKTFVAPDKMLTFLENYCEQNPGTRYLVRQHPSNPVVGERKLRYGVIPTTCILIETCIQLADIVLQETSTVGLQAALVGKPVVTVDAGDYPPYAQLELATDVSDLESVASALTAANQPNLNRLGYRNLGNAGKTIAQFITTLLEE